MSVCRGDGEEAAERLAKSIKAGEAQCRQGFCCPFCRSDWIAAKHTAASADRIGLELVASD